MKQFSETPFKLGIKVPTKRDLQFLEIMQKAEAMALVTGVQDPAGFSHAFLWAIIEVDGYLRRCLITGSENFENWDEVQFTVLSISGILYTEINWD